MTRIFDSDGRIFPTTVIQAGPCTVTQVKTDDTDGYNAIQLGFGDIQEKRINRPLKGHFQKAGATYKKVMMEFPVGKGKRPKPGQEYTVSMFKEGDLVSIRGTSKGKGFTGVIKRWGFSGGPKTHGQSNRLRAPGSIGQSASPSRVWPGMKMSGQHGNKTAVLKNLEVVKVDPEKNYLFIKGAVPGAKNGIVAIMKST